MRFQLSVLIIIIICFFSFQPRTLNYLFPSMRTSYLQQLINDTSSLGHLNPQMYWKTREFYYPGVFYVFQDGLGDNNFDNFTKQTGLSPQRLGSFPILVYNSSKWQSYEALVNTDKLEDLVKLPTSSPVYSDKETKIYVEGNKTYFFFIKSYDELKITNGFIYTKDQILKNYRYWFGVSVVTR